IASQCARKQVKFRYLDPPLTNFLNNLKGRFQNITHPIRMSGRENVEHSEINEGVKTAIDRISKTPFLAHRLIEEGTHSPTQKVVGQESLKTMRILKACRRKTQQEV